MNLSPSWIARLGRHGFEAVHWSTIGAATAPDEEILAWSRAHGFTVVTTDLDLSAILAATDRHSPSVVQVRMQDVLSDEATAAVAAALEAFRSEVEDGALLSVDESGTRVRMLPLRRPGTTS